MFLDADDEKDDFRHRRTWYSKLLYRRKDAIRFWIFPQDSLKVQHLLLTKGRNKSLYGTTFFTYVSSAKLRTLSILKSLKKSIVLLVF